MSLVSKLKEQRDGLVAEVEAALVSEDVTAEALDAVADKQAEIEKVDERIATVEAVEARSAALAESRKESGVKVFGGATVTREAHTYEKNGSNSFVRDMIAGTLRNDSSAWERLNRHQQEVAVELRDISRTDGAGGDFVPPIYLINEYAEFARAARVTADLVTNMALPAGTDSINIPQITTGTLAAFQSADNAATTTRDMVSSTVSAPVRTISGYENVSIQLAFKMKAISKNLLHGQILNLYSCSNAFRIWEEHWDFLKSIVIFQKSQELELIKLLCTGITHAH